MLRVPRYRQGLDYKINTSAACSFLFLSQICTVSPWIFESNMCVKAKKVFYGRVSRHIFLRLPRLEPVARVSNLTFQGKEDLGDTEMMQLTKLRCYFLRWIKRRLRLKTNETLELSIYDWEWREDRVRLAIPLLVPLLFLVLGYDTASPQMTEPQAFSCSFDPDCKVWCDGSKPLPARTLTILSFWIIQVF